MTRIKIPAQRIRASGTIQDKEVHIEILEDGVNIAATGTITFRSALVLAQSLIKIAYENLKTV